MPALPGRRQEFFLLLACALLYLAQSFVSWGWPALDGYPAIERWLDPQFLTADFYTNTTVKFGVDTPQAVVIGSLARLTGVDYATILAVLTALRHLLWPFVLFGFMLAWSGDRVAALLAVALGVLGNFALPRTLGWAWLWGDASTAMFAVLAATWAWRCFLARRGAMTLLLMTIACLLQPLVAVHAGIVLLLIFIIDFDAAERRAALLRPANIVMALIFATAFASQYVLLTPQGARLPVEDYALILVHERHPGDFLASRFGRADLMAFALAATALLVMAARCWQNLPRRGLMLAVLGTYAAICCLGVVFVEIWPVRLVIDLIPFRTVIIAAPMLLLIIGVSAADNWRRGNWLALLLLAAAFVAAGPLVARTGIGTAKPAALLLGAALASFLPLPPVRLPAWTWSVIAVVLAALVLPNAALRRDAFVIPTAANSHALYRWAQASTHEDARFLVEQVPGRFAYGLAISPQHMRLIGRRAVVASRDYPFAETDIRPWYRTWVIGLGHGSPDHVERASAATLAQICDTLPFDYVVRATPLAGMTPVATFAPQHGVGAIFVYRPCRLAG